MKLGLIYARAHGGVIGKDGVMPWHLPEDLAHFKAKTLGAPVIMGRKTWDSIPARFRPLPGRRNIVITRNTDWHAEGAERTGSLEEAIRLVEGSDAAWVTGGAGIFRQALPFAHVVEVTEIDASFEGDTFAPDLGPEWKEVARVNRVAANGMALSFVTYENSNKGN